ncbi:MAG: zf-HC2 domain-containing protein, partial [Blastocatellia bacterium]
QEIHPPPELLMLSVDGELPPDEAAQIESHLAACWVCRMRTTKIETTITDFIEYHQAILTSHLTPPANTWRNFDARLDSLAGELGRPPLLARLGARLREIFPARLSLARLAFVISIPIIAIAGFWLSRSPVASASELLERSIQAEMARINQVAEPVMYRKLQARRKSAGAEESVTWESWHSAKNDLFRQRVADKQGLRFIRASEEPAPALLTELERVFRANHLDARRPLSAMSYADWRRTVRPESETVTEVETQDRGSGLKLTTVVAGPHAADAIIEASLIVRSADWHPVAEHLKVQGENEIREYELSETAYEVMPLAALTVFAEPAPAPLPTVTPAAEITRIPAPSPSIKPAPTEAELRNAEVAALYTLHRLRADLGEQIEILRDPAGQVIVRGLVETADRKEQLIDALRDLDLVTTQIQTVEEAQRAVLEKLYASPLPVVSATADPGQARAGDRNQQQQAFRTALENYLASSGGATPQAIERRITELTNRSLALSEAALARAWALRRLAENPAFKQTDQLSPEAKTRLAAMLESHLRGLKEEIRNLRGELEPCLIFIAGGKPAERETPADKASDWAGAAMAVFQSVSQLDRLIHGMFSPNWTESASEAPARQALANFVEIGTALRTLESQTGRIAADK